MLSILDVTVIRHFSIPRIIQYALILFLSAKTVQRQWERPGQPSELCQGESAARSVYPNSGGGVGTTPGSAPAPPVKEKLSPRGGEGGGGGHSLSLPSQFLYYVPDNLSISFLISCPILNPFNIREKVKIAKNKKTNPPSFERGNAAKVAGNNVANLKHILARHCEDWLAQKWKKNCPPHLRANLSKQNVEFMLKSH